jgi:uncharacterized protein (DUF433 family)
MEQTTILAIEHIVKTPGVVGGEPRIAGRRLPVHRIIYEHEVEGTPVGEIAEIYDLTPAQVYAALAYYYDHKAEIDRLIAKEEKLVPPSESDTLRRTLKQRWAERKGADPDQDMTVTEISEEYGISPQAVREACKKEWIPARKSGSAWLIRRHVAEARWGTKDQSDSAAEVSGPSS